MWRRREIENYLCSPETLLHWARAEAERQLGPLFGSAWQAAMEASIRQVEAAMTTLRKGSPWSPDTKVSDDFLDPLFDNFFRSLDLCQGKNCAEKYRTRYMQACHFIENASACRIGRVRNVHGFLPETGKQMNLRSCSQ